MKERKIKICGLKNQENISKIAELSPDFIGFIFYAGSKRDATKIIDPEFSWSLDKKIKKVGVFVNDSAERIINYIALYNLDLVQLHGDERPAFCDIIRNYAPVIKAFGISGDFDFTSLSEYKSSADYFLFDTKTKDHGGSGNPFDHSLLKKYELNKKYFLAGGICAENFDSVSKIEDKRLFSFDVNSRFELAPGVKDIEKLKQILK
jgi:phosphoribosylanthranilate isomerase